jgi:hypothetical protein
LQALLNIIREINADYDSRQLSPSPAANSTPSQESADGFEAVVADALSDFARLQVRPLKSQ